MAVADVVSGEMVKKLALHRDPVRDVAWSPSDAVLVSGCLEGFTVEWRPQGFTDSVLTGLPVCRFHHYY